MCNTTHLLLLGSSVPNRNKNIYTPRVLGQPGYPRFYGNKPWLTLGAPQVMICLRSWTLGSSGWACYVGEFHPKCSKFGTIVHLGSKSQKKKLKKFFSLKGPFLQTLEKCKKCNFVIFQKNTKFLFRMLIFCIVVHQGPH